MARPKRLKRMVNALTHRGVMKRWRQIAQAAPRARMRDLRLQVDHARTLRGALSDFLHVAEERLAMPRIGSDAFPRPEGSDWSWRPDLFRAPDAHIGVSGIHDSYTLGHGLTLFHDCPRREITLRQLRNRSERDLAPYGIQLDVFAFEGSYLSLVLDLPESAAQGLKRRHIIRFDISIRIETPARIFARMNVQHGPNSEQILQQIPLEGSEVTLEFDLGYTDFNEKRSEKLWLDLIFEAPAMNQFTVRDITFSRYPRADL